jgi:hypothetical protein
MIQMINYFKRNKQEFIPTFKESTPFFLFILKFWTRNDRHPGWGEFDLNPPPGTALRPTHVTPLLHHVNRKKRKQTKSNHQFVSAQIVHPLSIIRHGESRFVFFFFFWLLLLFDFVLWAVTLSHARPCDKKKLPFSLFLFFFLSSPYDSDAIRRDREKRDKWKKQEYRHS